MVVSFVVIVFLLYIWFLKKAMQLKNYTGKQLAVVKATFDLYVFYSFFVVITLYYEINCVALMM